MSVWPNRRARVAAAGAALLLGALTSCGTAASTRTAPQHTAAQAAPEDETPTTDCGDPTASLRPLGPLPTAGSTLPAGTYPSVAKLQAQGYITVGIDQSTYPFGYIDPVTDQLRGFDIDLLRDVAHAIFGGPMSQVDSHIHYRVVLNADRSAAVERGDVDLLAETMTVNCQRRQLTDFSAVYFMAGQQVLVPSDPAHPDQYAGGLADLGGKRVCALTGSTSYTLIQKFPVTPKLVPVEGDTWADCLVKLQQGDVDAVSTDNTILAGLQAQDPYFTKVVGPMLTQEPYGIAVAQTRPDLERYVNAVLDSLRSGGGWAQLYSTYVGTSLGPTVPAPPTAVYRD